MDESGLAHHLPHLVALQMADEVQGRSVIGVLSQLGGHLLHPVLPQSVHSGGDGLLTGGGVVHLAGAHQNDIPLAAAAFSGGLRHLPPHGGNVFRNGHTDLSFPDGIYLCGCIDWPMASAGRLLLHDLSAGELTGGDDDLVPWP